MARTPGYLLHKPSGQARVRIDGKDHYLGEYGSEDSRQRYDALVACWLISKRNPDSLTVTINRLCILYLEHCETYYRKNGKVASEVATIRVVLRELVADCGKLPVGGFGPDAPEGSTISETTTGPDQSPHPMNRPVNGSSHPSNFLPLTAQRSVYQELVNERRN